MASRHRTTSAAASTRRSRPARACRAPRTTTSRATAATTTATASSTTPPRGCDQGLAANGDAFAFARAIGLCQRGDNTRWGVVSAEYTRGYNDNTAPIAAQHGILPKFGDTIRPREGAALGVLSSGYAREFNGANGRGTFKNGEFMLGGGAIPPGYPKASPGCVTLPTVFDVINVRLKIRVPKNAQGFQFDFNFFSGEWPEFVCTPYNDAFIAYLTSAAFNGGRPENISFDAQGSPVSVNNGFFDRCTPGAQTGCGIKVEEGRTLRVAACPGGPDELLGTGFHAPGVYCNNQETVGGGATGWLTSRAPVQAGEVITLEFYIWDTGDMRYDSSVLLDNFRWIAGKTETVTERPR